MVLDRTQIMVETLKNHPSIVIWSLGNEATYGSSGTNRDDYCFRISSNWILERDPSRIRKYERDNKGSVSYTHLDVYKRQGWKPVQALSRWIGKN